MAEDTRERIVRYLSDAHATEVGGLQTLKDIAAEANDPEVRTAFLEHYTQTQLQASLLEARLMALGGSTNGAKGVINTLFGKGSDLLNAFHDKRDKQTQDVIKAYSFEQFEVAMYVAMHAYATAVGDRETAALASQIMQEERLAGDRLLRLIPQLAVRAVTETIPLPPVV